MAGGRSAPATRASTAAVLLLALLLLAGDPPARAAGGGCTTTGFAANDLPRAIADPGSFTSTVAVPAGDAVRGLAVTVSISHPFDSDLRLELVSPVGKTVVLAEAVGTWGDDFSGTTFADDAQTSIVSALPPFAGRYRPAETLAALAGSKRAGTWRLRVRDLRGRYSGRLEAWRLDLTSCPGSTPVRRPKAGAPAPPPLATGRPSGSEPVEGRLVTVTSTMEGQNGDVSSVTALEAAPGPDGISLIEAIQATNNDPGTYTIRFDPSLAGATLAITNDLPLLSGGGVFIDGDVDGDGGPDLALAGGGRVQWGLNVASSGNRLHALTLRGFGQGVVFTAMRDERLSTPLLQGQAFARNIVSGVVLSNVITAISFGPTGYHQECERALCRTRSRWVDTRLVGNAVDSSTEGAIQLGWNFDNGDELRRATVAGNRLQVRGKYVNGVDLTIGAGGASDNRISDALVAHNAIEMMGGTNAVQVVAGQRGRSGNLVEDVRIVGNRIRFSGPRRPGSGGVAIFVSDDCWPPGRSVCQNIGRRIAVVGNVIDGPDVGVRVGEPCCSTTPRSPITGVRIAGNVIRSVITPPSQFLEPWGIVLGGLRAGVSNVVIDSNTVVQTGSARADPTAAGIAVIGGLDKVHTFVAGVSITNNRVETRLAGIQLLGGGPSKERAGRDPATGNRVTRVELRGNVTRRPILLIGGLGRRSTSNAVTCVASRDKVTMLPNVAGASGNVVRLGRC